MDGTNALYIYSTGILVAPQYKPVRPVLQLLASGDTFTAVVQNLTVQYTTIKCQHVYGRSAKTGSSVHYY